MLKRLRNWLFPVIEDPNDIGTGTEDIYVMSLDEVLRRLERDFVDPDADLVDYEDDTANFDLGGEG